MEAPAIRLRDVTFRYQEQGRRNILDHVSLEIPAGRITVLMGGGGCGKSTLAAVAAGLYPENGGCLLSGSVELFGHPLGEMNQQQRAAFLTLMFQNPDLQFCMDTLRKELRFCLENLCVPREEMDGRVLSAARDMGLQDRLDQPLHSLSGGEKQKAMLCCLRLIGSRCLLLDEALANIDRPAALELAARLVKLREQGGTVLAIDHRLDYWLDAADEIIVLGTGAQVLARGIRRENLRDYRELFQREGLYYPEPPRVKAPAKEKPGEAAAELRNVSIPIEEKAGRWGRKQAKRWLLSGANAVFPRGRMTALVGPSGSGKTTALLSLLKQHPYQGTILVHGQDLRKLRERELFSQIGMVFQNPGNQFVTQKVEDEVLSAVRLREKEEARCRERTEALLEAYGLKQYRRFPPYMLSQGQQRRLAVVSVLAGRQKLLLLDEPTYGQDRRATQAIMERLQEEVEAGGLTVIFITHDWELAAAWADRIYCLRDRKLVETAPSELLYGARKEERP